MMDITMPRRNTPPRERDGRNDVAALSLLPGRYLAFECDRFRIIRDLLAPQGMKVVGVDAAEKVQAKMYGLAIA